MVRSRGASQSQVLEARQTLEGPIFHVQSSQKPELVSTPLQFVCCWQSSLHPDSWTPFTIFYLSSCCPDMHLAFRWILPSFLDEHVLGLEPRSCSSALWQRRRYKGDSGDWFLSEELFAKGNAKGIRWNQNAEGDDGRWQDCWSGLLRQGIGIYFFPFTNSQYHYEALLSFSFFFQKTHSILWTVLPLLAVLLLGLAQEGAVVGLSLKFFVLRQLFQNELQCQSRDPPDRRG